MKTIWMTSAMALAGAVGACAQSPDAIAPSYVSDVTYRSWTCQDLGEESLKLDGAFQTAAAQQNQARTNDTVGVIFLGLPVASMSGSNVAPQIASLKGQQEAVHQASVEKHCADGPVPGAPTTVAAPSRAASAAKSPG